MNVAIVQARIGSTRLPGKVLRDLNGMPVLGHVLKRASAIPGIDALCCAVPDGAENEAIVEVAQRFGALVTRGPEADVLERYRISAMACGATVVMRITSDCPLLDPKVSGMVLSKLLASGADYVSNVDPRSWPRGLDTEALTGVVLDRMAAATSDEYDREHVTPWLRKISGIRRCNVALPDDRYAGWRWTLDYEEDLQFAREVLARVAAPPHLATFEEVCAVIEANPHIASINSHKV
jgi:spore coat polysaccharide biosynthesis protein SpsF (cytidylyltransferase family)